jgi:CRP/FNR family putative post-exponential-phase nitrogen-starvation transcriptional regulator
MKSERWEGESTMRVANAEKTIRRYVAEFDMASFLNDDLLRGLQLFRFPAYSHVYIEQAEQHYLYFLVEGQLQCSHYHPNGKLAVFAVSTPFSAIGDFEILTEERVYSNVIATQDTTMLGIASDLVHRYGADDPRFLRFLIGQLREKLYKTNSLQAIQVLPLASRLAAYMLSQPPAGDGGVIELPGKEGLASLLGATTRHLNRVLKELVETGAISPDYPRVRLLDKPALQALTN